MYVYRERERYTHICVYIINHVYIYINIYIYTHNILDIGYLHCYQ